MNNRISNYNKLLKINIDDYITIENNQIVAKDGVQVKKIGKGRYGTVYLIKTDNIKFALKQTNQPNNKETELMDVITKKSIEYKIPFFMMYIKTIIIGEYKYHIVELLDGTLDELIRDKDISLKEWNSILLQFYFGLHLLHKKLKILHLDASLYNIMLYNTDVKELKYDYCGTKIVIPLFGYIIIIGDYGHADYMDSNNENTMKKKKMNFDYFYLKYALSNVERTFFMNKFNVEQIVNFMKRNNIKIPKFNSKHSDKPNSRAYHKDITNYRKELFWVLFDSKNIEKMYKQHNTFNHIKKIPQPVINKVSKMHILLYKRKDDFCAVYKILLK